MNFQWSGTQTAQGIDQFGKGLVSLLIGDKIVGMAKKYVSKKSAKKATKRSFKRMSRQPKKALATSGSEGVNMLSALNFSPNSRGNNGIGNRRFATFVYSDRVGVSSSLTGLSGTGVNFSLNGLYDPDVSGTGHQPRGFDQWAALFKRYKVFKAEVELRFDTTVDATNYKKCGCWRILNPSNLSSTGAGLYTSDFIEEPQAAAIRILPNGEESYVKFTVDIPKAAGLSGPRDPLFGDNWTGSTSGNPGNQVYLQLTSTNDTATDNTACTVGVTIKYFAMLYNDVLLTQS